MGGIAVLCALGIVWRTNQPFDVEVRLNEASVHNENLPPLKNAIVTMRLGNETKSDTIHLLEDHLVFSNIPYKFLKKPVQVSVSCCDFLKVDTVLRLTQSVTLNICRDPKVYGDIIFQLWDWQTETVIANTPVQIDGIDCVSDSCGRVSFFIPLEQQKSQYHVTAPFPLTSDILTPPCCDGFAIVKK